MELYRVRFLMGALLLVLVASCVKFPDADIDIEEGTYDGYIYPFALENRFILAEIAIETDGSVKLDGLEFEIPPLKYNKSLLFFLTQDDCKQTAFCSTWAAINGRPLSTDFFYSLKHLNVGIFPTDTHMLGNTLGSTDGAGNEVRFHFTTTIAPDMEFMKSDIDVKRLSRIPNNDQFKERGGLVWDDLREMLNYGVGIAFHDVKTSNANNVDTVLVHYALAQNIILDSLFGRGCKALAEPDGNKTYVVAALLYNPIQIMTAQAGTIELYPCKLNCCTNGLLFNRGFYEASNFQEPINEQFALPYKERRAIHVGVHETGDDWANGLLWLNNTYGKDGNDSIWVPSLEEYCEYNYYRLNTNISKTIDWDKLILHVKIPMGQYLYMPSITINIKGLKKNCVTEISSNNEVSGLSYADYKDGLMINIDCRRYLYQMASYYVEKYEKNRSRIDSLDARYFVHQLKNSPRKKELLARIK
ncbi:MAG: hypothetical protein VB022_08675 [Rikenellaceae bacterium]|nr:hypothetical protein [Rikenellaceae bacterium]